MPRLLRQASSKRIDVRSLITSVIVVALVGAACSTGGSPSTIPSSSPTTTEAATTIGAGESSTTTLPDSETTTPAPEPIGETTLGLEAVADGFEQPVFYTTNGGFGFIVDQPGVIWFTAQQ